MIIYKNGKLYHHTEKPPRIEYKIDYSARECNCFMCNPNSDINMDDNIADISYTLRDKEIGIAIYQDPDFNSKNPLGDNIEIITNNNCYGVMVIYREDKDAIISRTGIELDLNKIIFYASLPSDVQNAFR